MRVVLRGVVGVCVPEPLEATAPALQIGLLIKIGVLLCAAFSCSMGMGWFVCF